MIAKVRMALKRIPFAAVAFPQVVTHHMQGCFIACLPPGGLIGGGQRSLAGHRQCDADDAVEGDGRAVVRQKGRVKSVFGGRQAVQQPHCALGRLLRLQICTVETISTHSWVQLQLNDPSQEGTKSRDTGAGPPSCLLCELLSKQSQEL